MNADPPHFLPPSVFVNHTARHLITEKHVTWIDRPTVSGEGYFLLELRQVVKEASRGAPSHFARMALSPLWTRACNCSIRAGAARSCSRSGSFSARNRVFSAAKSMALVYFTSPQPANS